MTTVYCSAKLTALIGKDRLPKSTPAGAADTGKGWNAHLFTFGRRKCVLITNKATLYSVVRLDILKKDLKDLPAFFGNALAAQLQADGLRPDLFTGPDPAGGVSFYTTDNDRKVIGSMNGFIFCIGNLVSHEEHGLTGLADTAVGTWVNGIIMGLLKYDSPLTRARKLQAGL